VKRKTAKPVRLFVSYSHENAVWFKRMRPILEFESKVDVVGVWHDQQLQAGDRWDQLIRDELDKMNIFVCLVSYEFLLGSTYIKTIELPRALERAAKDKVEIVPILLYDVNLDRECVQLKAFNPLPAWGKCWSEYEHNGGHYQNAHKPIRDGLWQAIEKVQSR
jgi:hypothetical protein